MTKAKENQNQESPELTQDPEKLDSGISQEWSPEISPELQGISIGEGAAPAQKISAPGKTAEQQAAELARDLGQIISSTVEGITGRDYGLNENAVSKWAEGVAPVLVKYGLTDMNNIMGQWGAEIQAGIATFALGAGCYSAHKKYKAEDEAKAKAKAEKETEQKEAA
ncbi:hypothetical protein [Shewanella algae]|uniref:hypothetical protein n=1 Tax=Shewanella algae TaxID=38313 RepID=UPI001AADE94C|nr:hypothetical protein [Shewanella algae]MBO2687987.1 hypothetical protein [Shewanella algae]